LWSFAGPVDAVVDTGWGVRGVVMGEPIIDLGIGFLFAALIAFGIVAAMRSRASRAAVLHLPSQSASPPLMTVIEADMDQMHSQIAVATRRLEICVEQMKSKTTGQLAEIGRTSETIGRLKAEMAERTATLAALQDKERAVSTQLHTTTAELAAKLRSLEETEQRLSDRKAEFARLMNEFNLHPELAKAESRHAAEMERLKAEKAAVELELTQSRKECAKLQDYIESMQKQVETTWASERMANAVLRERINDVASEVVRVAVALEGLNSPIDSLVAAKTTNVPAAAEAPLLTAEGMNGDNGISLLPSFENGNGTSSELIHRIRALRQRAARTTAAP
jgi:septal ring factor EnvC (AmiA/AmiB activator)